MTSEIIVLGFYKYVNIENVDVFRDELHFKCSELKLKGNILLAREGINASISGTLKDISQIRKYLKKIKGFEDLFFKEEKTFEHPFRKMKVKLKKEIVAFKHKVNLKDSGKHISPQELSDLYEEGKLKENVVILDARNDYEYKIGKFKEAIHLNLNVFREFKNNLNELKHQKEKKIIRYIIS